MIPPAIERAKDVMPMATKGKISDDRVLKPVTPKEIPTAKASILVAMASMSITFMRVGSKQHFFLVSKYSIIMRTPMYDNRPKAIQWSYALIESLKKLIPSHPKSGIIA